MRILIADKLASFVPSRLQDLGARVDVDTSLSADKLADAIRSSNPDVLIVRSTQVDASHIDAGVSLSLIIRAGAGVNTIDVKHASSKGVYVANCPGKNSSAVAELTIGHLINLDRRISDQNTLIRQGQWDKKTFGSAHGLRNRTLAVFGAGQIGRLVIKTAQSLGMHVVVWSKGFTEEEASDLDVSLATTPEAAAAQADAISVHLPLTDETKARIGESVFSAMKPGTYFINTSRGEVVDEAALEKAIKEKKIRVGLDVFNGEPKEAQSKFEHPLAQHPSVYGTCHIGASTDEAEEAVGEEAIRIVKALRDSMPIPHCVNLALTSLATHMLVVRHHDKVGVLAQILKTLSEAGHNVQEMENILFKGGASACARIAIVTAPNHATLNALSQLKEVLSVGVTPIV